MAGAGNCGESMRCTITAIMAAFGNDDFTPSHFRYRHNFRHNSARLKFSLRHYFETTSEESSQSYTGALNSSARNSTLVASNWGLLPQPTSTPSQPRGQNRKFEEPMTIMQSRRQMQARICRKGIECIIPLSSYHPSSMQIETETSALSDEESSAIGVRDDCFCSGGRPKGDIDAFYRWLSSQWKKAVNLLTRLNQMM